MVTDHLGSTRVIFGTDGAVLQRFDYKPFGEDLVTTAERGEKYTGKTQDGIGLYYYGSRFYDAELGRFISVDPIKDGLNWYVYCANNPLKYVDPTGLVLEPEEGIKGVYDKAIAYLNRSKTAIGLINALDKSETVYKIAYTDRPEGSYLDPKTNTIYWNPEEGISVDSAGGKVTTSALVLAHEMGHAESKNAGTLKKDSPDDPNDPNPNYQYDSEEKRNLITWEQRIAKELKEPVRLNYYNHRGLSPSDICQRCSWADFRMMDQL